MRLLIFLLCLGAGTAALLVSAGGWRGRGPQQGPGGLPRQAPPAAGAPVPMPSSGGGALRVRTVGAPRYAMPEPLVFEDPQGGPAVEIPHFLPWAFAADGAHAEAAGGEDASGFVFEDVTLRVYRAPETRAEAERLRDNPRLIDEFVRLEVRAPRARADGIARALQDPARASAGVAGTSTEDGASIVLDGGIEARDHRLGVLARGEQLRFEPHTGVARGQGLFTVQHAAWSLQGEGFSLVPEAGAPRRGLASSFRVELEQRVFLAVDAAVLDPAPPGAGDAPGFRPARVFAGRAGVVRDTRAPDAPLVLALEQGVRALQQGGRRLQADRLVLELAPQEGAQAPARAALAGNVGRWRLAHLHGEGSPLAIEVPDLAEQGGLQRAAVLRTARLRHAPGTDGLGATTTLEGPSELLLEGDVTFAGTRAPSARLRASARERMQVGPAPGGRRIEMRGLARLERLPGSPDEAHDLLEADSIALELRPARPEEGLRERELPTRLAALGHVRLGGTRLEGEAQRLVVEGLDGLAPRIVVEGEGSRLSLVGFERGQRLLGADTPEAVPGEPGAEHGAPEARAWTLDRLEASGSVAAQTRLGGPTAGMGAWVDGDSLGYERLSERALLLGSPTSPASIRVAAGGSSQHLLQAPRIAFERARGRLRADEGVRAEVWVAGDARTTGASGLAREEVARGALSRLDFRTEGRIEVDLRVSRPGGELAPEQPQVVRVLAPFEATLRAPPPDAVDRIAAGRLEAVLALRAPGASSSGAALARTARARERTPARSPTSASAPAPAAAAPAQRWSLDARALQVDLDLGEPVALLAEGGMVLESPALRLEASSLSYSRALGLVAVEGGPQAVKARLGGEGDGAGELAARALRVGLDAAGPRWVQAAGPVQAVLLRAAPDRAALLRQERLEFACPGDVRITDGQLLAERGPSWVRRSVRAQPGAPWAEATDIWADRMEARGMGLLAGGRATAGQGLQALVARGPATTFRTQPGKDLVEMWCERIDVDLVGGRAQISGSPERAVLLRVAGRFDSELLRASFDFRTGALEDLEAGRTVLRQGR